MTGTYFVDRILPHTRPRWRKDEALHGNQAIWNGEILDVSPEVYWCLVDNDTCLSAYLSLEIDYCSVRRYKNIL